MELESKLHRALRRESPPADFASRVMRRIEADAQVPPRRPAWWRAAAAAALFVAIGGGWAARHEMERRAGERARAEAIVALQIASAKLHFAQQHVQTLTSNPAD